MEASPLHILTIDPHHVMPPLRLTRRLGREQPAVAPLGGAKRRDRRVGGAGTCVVRLWYYRNVSTATYGLRSGMSRGLLRTSLEAARSAGRITLGAPV